MISLFFIFIVLGLVQGLAEFLPVSSSGHLVLFQQIPWFKDSIEAVAQNQMLFINVSLHLASLTAVIIFLWQDITTLVVDSFKALFARNFKDPSFITALYIIAASIPAAIIGLLFNDFIEHNLSKFLPVSIMLIINGFILISTKRISQGNRQLNEIGIYRALTIGLFQAIAIIPGISRSGMTISGGMLLGVEPEKAARFSFLMSIPVIAGAGLLETGKALSKGLDSSFFLPLLAGAAACTIVALLALRLLFVIVRKTKINLFGYYTIAVGTAGVILYTFM